MDCKRQWESMGKINADILHFREMWDIHPFIGPVVNTEIVVFENCDKNFVYYWATPRVLPKAKHVYLFSHPCEPIVFRTLDKMNVIIHMDEPWKRYAERWAPRMLAEGRIKIIKDYEARNFIQNLDKSFPNQNI